MANLFGEPQHWVFWVPGNPIFPVLTDPGADVTLASYVENGSTLPALPARGDAAAISSGERSLGPANTHSTGAAIGSFSDWYVDQIWIFPSPINFGSIIGERVVTVNLLSTFRTQSRLLSSIDLSEVGLGVAVQAGVLPHTFSPLEELNIELTATVDGPPSFDGNVIFNFDHRDIEIRSFGTRLILFWYEPEQPLEERLQWFTEIHRVRNGDEFRDSKRVTPRQILEFRIVGETEAEVSELRSLLLAYRPFTFGVPIWFERKKVTSSLAIGQTVIQISTLNTDHRVGGTIMVWEPLSRTYFDAEIASFTTTSITVTQPTPIALSSYAEVLPIRFGYLLEEPSMQDTARGNLETTVVFETTDNVDLGYANQAALEAAFTVHPEDDIPIFNDRNLFNGTYSQSQTTQFARLDNQIGIPELRQQNPLGFTQKPAASVLRGEDRIRRARAFLHWLRGSWGSFYLPTFRNDLPAQVDFLLNGSVITIANIGLSSLISLTQPRRSVMLELPNGTQYFAQVGSVTPISETQEQIGLVNPFGATATTVVAATARISWLELVRINNDTATIEHERVGQAILRMQVRTIQR